MTEGKKTIEHYRFEYVPTKKVMSGDRQSDLRFSKGIDLAIIAVSVQDIDLSEGELKREVVREARGNSGDRFRDTALNLPGPRVDPISIPTADYTESSVKFEAAS